MKLICMFDGGCRTSRGVAAGAAVAYDEHGNELATRSQILHRTTTPVAEYWGLILALQLAHELGGTDVTILGDAELIVRQVDGRYACRQAHLRPLLENVRGWMATIPRVEVREFPKAGPRHKRRHGNVHADRLCNEAMDAELAG
jgi:ribonuclease HI